MLNLEVEVEVEVVCVTVDFAFKLCLNFKILCILESAEEKIQESFSLKPFGH